MLAVGRITTGAVALAVGATVLTACTSAGTNAGPTTAPVACPSVAPTPVAAGADGTVTSGGIERTYNLWLPPGGASAKPTPLILDFHATGSPSLAYEQDFSPMADVAPGRGYIVVAPQGSSEGVAIPHWTVPGFGTKPDDVKFAEDLVDQLASRYCVDRDRVYATGASDGAAMTGVLACRSDLIAAAAPVAGVNLARPCPGARPLPIVAFQGKQDVIAAYEGSPGSESAPATEFFLGDVDRVMAGWAQRNRCSPVKASTVVAGDVYRDTWSGCAAGADTQLYVATEAGHTYPGGKPWPAYVEAIIGTKEDAGGQTDSIKAVDLILDFFDTHRRVRS